ncbi:uncharacterized protein [Triticum aestivum]|uniref:uncharacterized protein isoform X2 n=1 Tax=Triticum aestivum TaxID=4565 RepID=UPI001D023251|nr:uncharacterized protein LOC123053061 isoform X2 [Triticum aestivum]
MSFLPPTLQHLRSPTTSPPYIEYIFATDTAVLLILPSPVELGDGAAIPLLPAHFADHAACADLAACGNRAILAYWMATGSLLSNRLHLSSMGSLVRIQDGASPNQSQSTQEGVLISHGCYSLLRLLYEDYRLYKCMSLLIKSDDKEHVLTGGHGLLVDGH